MSSANNPPEKPLSEAQKAKIQREKRLSEALRANLRRRKAANALSDCPPSAPDLSPAADKNTKEP